MKLYGGKKISVKITNLVMDIGTETRREGKNTLGYSAPEHGGKERQGRLHYIVAQGRNERCPRLSCCRIWLKRKTRKSTLYFCQLCNESSLVLLLSFIAEFRTRV